VDLPDVDPVVARLPAVTARARAARVLQFALAQVGKPYVFGADGPDSFDCSGLVLAAYERIGIWLPHAAVWQAATGEAVDWRHDGVHPGDLVFMRGGRPAHDLGHVGIAVNATTWVEAARPGGTVEVAPIPFGRIQRVRRLVGA
jgi:cell wall-associated NlpC family hydrolase